jgi:di/tricarboxylate transporter
VVGLAAFDVLPIVMSALLGATAMVLSGCLNVRQAARAVDRRIFLLVGAALAMGTALEHTGGAAYLAKLLAIALDGQPPAIVLSAFFLLVALMTNVLSNNATAVLFTPIGANLAAHIGVDPFVFLTAVIFGSNCSYATPMGYQTNLLVMGPGHYKFADYVRCGGPLMILVWLTYSLYAPWYFGL